MSLFGSKKGMYEYILTKSVMLIFILALVSIFLNFYNTMSLQSADEIANSEAERIAKQIDDIIGFKGVSNSAIVHLSRDLKVGKDIVPYSVEITKEGVVIVKFDQYPYQDVMGFAQFGLKIAKDPEAPSADKILCEWQQIANGAKLEVTKDSTNEYDTGEEALYYVVRITIDAAEDCNAQMKFYQRFKESG